MRTSLACVTRPLSLLVVRHTDHGCLVGHRHKETPQPLRPGARVS
jgi:hypothetical protein